MIGIFVEFNNHISMQYDRVLVLKESSRGSVTVLRHRTSGHRYILREFAGTAEVYRHLLRIDCQYLPRIYEVVESNEHVRVLEEYIEGDNLADMLEDGLFTPSESSAILRQLCRALWVLHSLGLVHRDIKPENVILQGSRAVLIDFDASRTYKSEHKADTQILGTIGYAPPEQYGFSQTDGRADIYALGVLLNVMLTGHHPSKQPARGRLGRIIRRCTMIAPENRFQNVRQLLDYL